MKIMQALLQLPLLEALGWTLVHFLWQGAALALLAAFVLNLFSLRSVSRYRVCCLAMLLCMACPVATFFMIHDGMPAQDIAVSHSSVSGNEKLSAPDTGNFLTSGALAGQGRTMSVWFQPWVPFLSLAWMVGLVLLCGNLMLGWLQVRGIVRNALPFEDAHWRERLEFLKTRMGIRNPVRLLHSAAITIPQVTGWLRPVILFPTSLLTGFSAAQLELILTHELAHIRRHDYFVNVLQTVVETLFFYHPAVWWLGRRIREERECCCDEMVVNSAVDRVAYMKTLTELAAFHAVASRFALSAGGGSLLYRIQNLISSSRRLCQSRPRAVGFSVLSLIVMGILVNVWLRVEKENPRMAASVQNDRAYINGKVVDGNGIPVSGAEVRIADNTADFVLTDRMGVYKLPVNALAKHSVFAQKGKHPLGILTAAEISGRISAHAKFLDDIVLDAKTTTVTVRDQEGRPLKGVLAYLGNPPTQDAQKNAKFFQDRFVTKSDADGRFRILMPHGSESGIQTVLPGYRKGGSEWRSATGDITMSETGNIVGTAFDQHTGAPLANIPVQVQQRNMSPSATSWAMGMTAADGKFIFKDFPVGAYDVFLAPDQRTSAANLATVRPSQVNVAAHQDVKTELYGVRGIPVTGRVLDGMSENPLMSDYNTVHCKSLKDSFTCFVTAGKDGRFALSLLPGEYELVYYNAAEPEQISAPVALRVSADGKTQPFVLRVMDRGFASTTR